MAKIERLPSGNCRTRVFISAKDSSDGKRHQKSITASSPAEVRRLVVKYEQAHLAGVAPMLCDAVDAYVASRVAVCSAYSVRGYRNIAIVLWRLPEAHVACDAPSSAFQGIINALASSGKSPKTIKNYAGLISAAVKFAGFSAPVLTLPARQKKEMFIPDEALMRSVLDAARGTRLEVPVALGMMGLRRGEVCAVRDTDIQMSVLHISRAAVEIQGVVSEKAPKTYESDRRIRIPSEIAKKIRTEGRATEMSPSQLTDQFSLLLKRAGLPHFRFHDLRHFFVSYAHNVLRLSDAQIQKMGGWRTDYVMKRHYLQSMDDSAAQKKAAAAFGSLLR